MLLLLRRPPRATASTAAHRRPHARRRTLVFFNPLKRREKRGGIALFFLGIALVLMKRSFIGIIVELFGMVAMFGGLLPIVVSFLGAFPVIGPIVTSPAVTAVVSRLAGAARRPPV